MPIVLALIGVATPAVAGLIYTWEDSEESGATGSVEFADGVTEVNSAADVLDFAFETPGGRSFDQSFAFDALGNFLVGGAYLECCGGVVKKKSIDDGAIENDAVEIGAEGYFLDFRRSKLDATLFHWSTFRYVNDADDAVKKTTREIDETGTGSWVLVRVPEPSALLLLFAGLGLFGAIRKRVFTRTT